MVSYLFNSSPSKGLLQSISCSPGVVVLLEGAEEGEGEEDAGAAGERRAVDEGDLAAFTCGAPLLNTVNFIAVFLTTHTFHLEVHFLWET